MIARIKGTVSALADPPRLFINTQGGIMYEVHVPSSMLSQASQDAVEASGIWVWQVFGEDHQTLYGFYGHQDRDLAMTIRTVQGMGPVSSVKLVQAAGYDLVMTKIAEGNPKALAALCSGLGLKRAQAIITELQTSAARHGPSTAASGARLRFARIEAGLEALGIIGPSSTSISTIMLESPDIDDAKAIQIYLSRLI